MIQTFLQWWLDQLATLIPASWRSGEPAGRSAVLLSWAGDGVLVSQRHRGQFEPLGRFTADQRGTDALGEQVRRIAGRAGSVSLVIPADQVLRKSLVLPSLARKNLRQVLELEMEHETPFSAEEVVWDHVIARHDRASGRMDVEILLIPRERLAGLQQLAAKAGLAADAVEIAGDSPRRIPLSDRATRGEHGRHMVAIGLAAVAALLAVAIVTLPFIRLELALLALRGEVAALHDKVAVATSLRADIDALSRPVTFFARERARVREPLAVMAAATNALPDDTYLTEFALRGDRVTMVGLSPAAATLIPALAAARPLENPTFSAPVVRPDGNKLELFTITAGLAAAAAK